MNLQHMAYSRFQPKPLIRRLVVLTMLVLLTLLDIAQPCGVCAQEPQLIAGTELPAGSMPEPEWLDTAEDGDETMLDPLTPVLVSLRTSGIPKAAHTCHILLPDRGVEPPPPWHCI